jgi:hypothetical protein
MNHQLGNWHYSPVTDENEIEKSSTAKNYSLRQSISQVEKQLELL